MPLKSCGEGVRSVPVWPTTTPDGEVKCHAGNADADQANACFWSRSSHGAYAGMRLRKGSPRASRRCESRDNKCRSEYRSPRIDDSHCATPLPGNNNINVLRQFSNRHWVVTTLAKRLKYAMYCGFIVPIRCKYDQSIVGNPNSQRRPDA